jgi:hypothetical protein
LIDACRSSLQVEIFPATRQLSNAAMNVMLVSAQSFAAFERNTVISPFGWETMSSVLELMYTLLGGALAGEALHRAVERGIILRKWLEDHNSSAEIEQFLAAEMIRAHPQLYDYLRADLERSNLSVDGTSIKMMTRDLGGQELVIPVAVIGTKAVKLLPSDVWDTERLSDWSSAPHVRIQEKLGRVIQDNVCYSARSVAVSSGVVSIKGALTTYGSALATQDVLEWEFLDQGRKYLSNHSGDFDFSEFGNLLLRRKAVTQNTENYILDGAGPCNSLAISTLIVYQDRHGEYRLLIGKRSAQTGAHAHLFHVVPACMFQPELGNVNAEWSIFHNVLKEYLEEIFSVELRPNAVNATYFYDHPRAVSLRNALRSGDVEFTVTGMVVNLLNLRPEICALILVKDSDWWRREQAMGKMNWEYSSRETIMEQSGRAWTDFRLQSVEAEFSTYFGAAPGSWVPSGLASLWLGVDAARARI